MNGTAMQLIELGIACLVGLVLALLMVAALSWWAYCWFVDELLGARRKTRNDFDRRT